MICEVGEEVPLEALGWKGPGLSVLRVGGGWEAQTTVSSLDLALWDLARANAGGCSGTHGPGRALHSAWAPS